MNSIELKGTPKRDQRFELNGTPKRDQKYEFKLEVCPASILFFMYDSYCSYRAGNKEWPS